MGAALERYAAVFACPIRERNLLALRLVYVLYFRLWRQTKISARMGDVPRKTRKAKIGIHLIYALYARHHSPDNVVYHFLLLEVERQRTLVGRNKPRRSHIVRELLIVVYHHVMGLYIVYFLLGIFLVVIHHTQARAELGILNEKAHALRLRKLLHSTAVDNVRMPHLARIVEHVGICIARPAYSKKVSVIG